MTEPDIAHAVKNSFITEQKQIARSDWSVSHYHLPVGARQEAELAR